MSRVLRHFAWFGAIAAVLGLGVAWMGLISIAASTEHWGPAKWFLHFTMRQSVQAQARGATPPGLADPLRVQRGAGAYAQACATCHGAPGQPAQLFASLMIPPAPPLQEAIAGWQARELFWIVQNGIKYTAMPAWPAASREDEVWNVVAFLQELPRMSPPTYQQLALGMPSNATQGQGQGQQDCAACHGEDGQGRGGTAPALAAQNAAYLEQSLLDYAAGSRASGVMQPIAQQLGAHRIRQAAAHYAALPRRMQDAAAGETARDAAEVEPGRRIARIGIPERDIPPCAACHGMDGDSTHDTYPDLAGQTAEYLELQLRLFREGRHGGSRTTALMQTVTQGLGAAEAAAVARYYAATPVR